MKAEPLDVLPIWAIFLVTCAIIWGAMESGYWYGRWKRRRSSNEKEAPLGAMVGSILALLAFMLAFTFGLAATRFEERRQVVLQEANAIGTAWLRTQLLPQPQRSESESLLRQYVDVRLPDATQGNREEVIAGIIKQSEEIQKQLWSEAMSAAGKDPSIRTGLFVQALNDVIDLHSKRVMVVTRNRIPIVIWVGLYGLAILGIGSTGYQAGVAEARRSVVMFGLILAFALVLSLIADLDRFWEGLIIARPEALLDLQRTMKIGNP